MPQEKKAAQEVPQKKKNLHEGHRQRLKQQFLEQGERGFNDHQLLELLLFYGIPLKDTNELAHTLLNHFGSLEGVFRASVKELCAVNGVKENAALLLNLVSQLQNRLQTSGQKETIVSQIEDAAEYLEPYFDGVRREQIYLLCGDQKGRVLGCELLSEGGDISVGLDTRVLTQTALRYKATWVVLAHSHPSGVAIPSGADIITTRKCQTLLRGLDIKLWDHLIFADGDYVSMGQSRLLD
jgi:DNA repair protein RadC